MLMLIAEICFYTAEDTAGALKNDPSTDYILRPAINFGNDLLFSGTLIANSAVKSLTRGKEYNVIIEMPTIEDEAYSMIKHLVKVDANFKIQTASRVIGYGRIVEFLFE